MLSPFVIVLVVITLTWAKCVHGGPIVGSLEVPQDHFDALNKKKWHQTFFVNDTFWDGPQDGAPVFLCVGGEGPPLDETVVRSSPHCNLVVEWLKETKAIMFAVEHRYYTCHNMSACPVDSFDSVDSYRFLSSAQAIEDLAWFHTHATKQYGLSRNNRWVVFGGSYPGMLAAFARIKYPHLFFASVASSAPVKASLEMKGYFDVVAAAYKTKSVGGSQNCHDRIASGHVKIGQMLKSQEGRRKLESLFHLGHGYLDNEATWPNFAGMGVADFPCQSNDPNCKEPVCNIQKVCEFLLQEEGDDVEALAKLRTAQVMRNINIDDNPQMIWGMENRLERSLLATPKRVSSTPDFWSYQVCTEFGYLQTCTEDSNCMFTKGLNTLEWMYDQICTNQFSMPDMKYTERLIEATNVRYGARHTDIERILWVNGSIDPWIALSITNLTEFQKARDQVVLLVEGASHHAWTHPSDPNDQSSVKHVRSEIKSIVSKWLEYEQEYSSLM